MKFLRAAFVLSFATMCGLAACVADDPSTGDDTTGNDASTDGSGGGDGTVGPGADGSTSDSSTVDSGPKRYCQTVSAPDGSADFFCADFDGTRVDEEFPDGSAMVDDGGTLALTTAVAYSAPNALLSQLNSPDENNAFFAYSKTGANNLETVTASVRINPPTISGMGETGGEVHLFAVHEQTAPNQRYFALSYVTDEDLPDASGYDGYALFIHPGVIIPQRILLPTLPSGWTDVSLTFDLGAGTITVAYNGVVQAVATQVSYGATDTAANVDLGTQNFGSVNSLGFRYDNFRVSTTRVDGG